VSLCTPRLQASISATPKWEGHRPQNQGGEGGAICHSLRYVTADVAFSTAAASARLGKFTDALSLLKFAEINGARAKVCSTFDVAIISDSFGLMHLQGLFFLLWQQISNSTCLSSFSRLRYGPEPASCDTALNLLPCFQDATRGRRGGLAWDGEQSSDSLKR
jgi:hypothetical protein